MIDAPLDGLVTFRIEILVQSPCLSLLDLAARSTTFRILDLGVQSSTAWSKFVDVS